jgi:hypothetical protein
LQGRKVSAGSRQQGKTHVKDIWRGITDGVSLCFVIFTELNFANIMNDFKSQVREGIPAFLPEPKPWDPSVNHAPRRRDLLTTEEKKLALRNALRYFPASLHGVLAPEFAAELRERRRIYMYRYRLITK